MSKVLIFCQNNNERTTYIFKTLLSFINLHDIHWTNDVHTFTNENNAIRIAYSYEPFSADILHLPISPILEETQISLYTHQHYKKLAQSILNKSILDFDFLGLAFYALTRYEEYFFEPIDVHQRFLASQSAFFPHTNQPLVDVWTQQFLQLIQKYHPNHTFKPSNYQFVLTFDLDNAYAFKGKSLARNCLAAGKDLAALNFKQLLLRFKVLFGFAQDPYDSYAIQEKWVKELNCPCIYFVPIGKYNKFDKNLSPKSLVYKKLLEHLQTFATIAWHPSYHSNSSEQILKKEYENFKYLLPPKIRSSRQHFLKMAIPRTYQNLVKLGIEADYTMGFADNCGFRAGTSKAFYFFDLSQNKPTSLLIQPFAIMDGVLKDRLKLTPNEALNFCKPIIDSIKATNGTFVLLLHNHSIADYGEWEGWQSMFKKMIDYAHTSTFAKTSLA